MGQTSQCIENVMTDARAARPAIGVAAFLSTRDEADRLLRADQEFLANRFCPTRPAFWRSCKASVTWAPDGCSYMSEHGNEDIARWAGYRALEQDDEDQDGKREPIWMGTVQTERGTYVAQFEVMAAE